MNFLLVLGFLVGFPSGFAGALLYMLWRAERAPDELCSRHRCSECKKDPRRPA